jgi:hypothetical protein
MSFAFLLLLSAVVLASTGCFGWRMTYAGLSCDRSTRQIEGDSLPWPGQSQVTAQGHEAYVWLELGATGIFTPATTSRGLSLASGGEQTPPILDELAQKGYIAIRVPHAPPTYTTSILLPGIPPSDPDAVIFSYYAPPTATELTTVAISVTRRAEYEAIVNQRYPITDGESHWEVWWLPDGQVFPIPDQPFRLDTDSWPPPLALRFRADFVDADALACAGCEAEVLAYNGYVFVGPFPFLLRFTDLPDARDPLVLFGAHCAAEDPPLLPTLGQYITPTVPFTHTFCLENWDSVTRTFTITASSSQNWQYVHFYQDVAAGAPPVLVGNAPFTVTVDPPGPVFPGILGLHAVYTPDSDMSDSLRETLRITATSVLSPEVQASAVSFALAPGYVLDETGAGYRIYLPLVLRSS